MRASWFVVFMIPLMAAGCSPSATQHQHAQRAADTPPPLFDDLGTHHQKITTSSPQAQAYFDQGLRLVYAFNYDEAQRAFREATRLDPDCAMCAWGVALTYGANYNSPTDADRERGAWEAIQRARANAARATEREQAIIEALAARHALDPKADRAALDRAYADAMREVARRFPDDLDAATVFADAMMNLRPWRLWTEDGKPEPGTEEIVQTLERVLAAAPNHPGANHLYIHAVEASPDPERGTAAADRLGPLMPGAGHLVHMPSHIYLRVDRYTDAVTANERAVAADRAYFKKGQPSPAYRMGYYPHNIDFIWLAASMEGRSADTIRAARELAAAVPPDMVRAMPEMETGAAAPYFALARFGRWTEILHEKAPAAGQFYVTGAWRYARGLAFAATGRAEPARAELAELRKLAETVPADRTIASFFKQADMLRLASDTLAGEIAARGGDTTTAVRYFSEAVRSQDGHWFTEPPPWYFPVRQTLGAALLAGGRPAEAEEVYRADLNRNPLNGWSLFGLAQSLRAQDRTAEASIVELRFQRAWARADVTLTASRF
ncbi:MAG: tetratricopeptide repeat protein [Candidatus Rokuibacteriota bacterium]